MACFRILNNRVLTVACLATVLICHFADGAEEETTKLRGDLFCGPCAVQRVLRYYDRTEELPALVREMQWPDVERGTSIAQLAKTLQDRGLFTRAVEIPAHVQISWNGPVIVHLRHQNDEHYVVWLPPSSPQEIGRIWDNSSLSEENGQRTVELFNYRSGPVLLTSEKPISDPVVAGECQNGYISWWQMLLVGSAALAAGMFIFR